MRLSTPFFVSPSPPRRDWTLGDLVLALLGSLRLGGTPELLGTVLALFACGKLVCCSASQQKGNEKRTLLSASLLNLSSSTDTDEAVVRLEFLQSLV